MDEHSIPAGTELIEGRYPFTCPVCGTEGYARPSMFMQMGYNSGGGSCLSCETYLKLRIELPGNTRMIATTYNGELTAKIYAGEVADV